MSEFNHMLIDLDENGNIVEVGEKSLYNIDNIESVSDWTQNPVKKIEKTEFPQFANAIKPETSKWGEHKTVKNSLGYFYCHSNNIAESAQFTGLYTGVFKDGHGFGINIDNFRRCCSAFAARRLIKGNWINDKDEYMKPNTDDPRYPEFENEALVFSLFDSNSQQSSLRGVEYKGKIWNVKNEFFWMPKAEIQTLANEARLDRTYADARTDSDRYMFKELSKTVLSNEAKAVLGKASDIVRKTMKFRELFDDEHKEYQILNWDCGWYQIKALAKQYAPENLKEFKELYKKLADKMRPMVYELGFLKK